MIAPTVPDYDDHVREAVLLLGDLSTADGADEHQLVALQAIGHALIAIADRLDSHANRTEDVEDHQQWVNVHQELLVGTWLKVSLALIAAASVVTAAFTVLR